MRLCLTVWIASSLALTAACGPDREPTCRDAYQHLLELAKRNHEPDLQRRFVEACLAAWDEGRITCLMGATTPEDANECRATKKRPG